MDVLYSVAAVKSWTILFLGINLKISHVAREKKQHFLEPNKFCKE